MSHDPLVVKPEVKLSDAVGRTLICDDGIPRQVVDITFSLRYKDKCIINERDSETGTGYFIHTLSVVQQLQGKGVPSVEAMQAATKVWASMYYEEGDGPLSRLKMWRKTKSGVILPFD